MDKTETKTVYVYNSDGKYVGEKILDWTDRSQISATWQIPAQCTEKKVLAQKDGFSIVWNGSKWQYQEIKKEEVTPEPEKPTIEDTEYVSKDTIEIAEAMIDVYDHIETLYSRLTVLEGGEA